MSMPAQNETNGITSSTGLAAIGASVAFLGFTFADRLRLHLRVVRNVNTGAHFQSGHRGGEPEYLEARYSTSAVDYDSRATAETK